MEVHEIFKILKESNEVCIKTDKFHSSTFPIELHHFSGYITRISSS